MPNSSRPAKASASSAIASADPCSARRTRSARASRDSGSGSWVAQAAAARTRSAGTLTRPFTPPSHRLPCLSPHYSSHLAADAAGPAEPHPARVTSPQHEPPESSHGGGVAAQQVRAATTRDRAGGVHGGSVLPGPGDQRPQLPTRSVPRPARSRRRDPTGPDRPDGDRCRRATGGRRSDLRNGRGRTTEQSCGQRVRCRHSQPCRSRIAGAHEHQRGRRLGCRAAGRRPRGCRAAHAPTVQSAHLLVRPERFGQDVRIGCAARGTPRPHRPADDHLRSQCRLRTVVGGSRRGQSGAGGAAAATGVAHSAAAQRGRRESAVSDSRRWG